MPRKFKTEASVAQNRNNQRLSRARQKERLDDMRSRLEEYEKRGVAATLEMQTAAKHVARENVLLRVMLLRRGVEREEVQGFLREVEGREVGDVVMEEMRRRSARSRAKEMMQGSRRASTLDASVRSAKGGDVSGSSTQQISSVTHPSTNIISPPCAVEKTCVVEEGCCATNEEDAKKPIPFQPMSRPGHHKMSNSTDQTSLPRNTAAMKTSSTSNEISCQAAAEIIAQLYDQGDAAKALLALGCSGTDDCFVKNSTVFQLMDEAV